MLSNLALHRHEAGWGRSRPDGKWRGRDPTGFRPVVKEFGDIGLTISGGEETPPVLGRW